MYHTSPYTHTPQLVSVFNAFTLLNRAFCCKEIPVCPESDGCGQQWGVLMALELVSCLGAIQGGRSYECVMTNGNQSRFSH